MSDHNSEDTEYGDGAYWEFTPAKLTVHDSTDLANGKPINYTYNESTKTLSISGFNIYKVTKLTSSEMTLSASSTAGQFSTTTIIEFNRM